MSNSVIVSKTFLVLHCVNMCMRFKVTILLFPIFCERWRGSTTNLQKVIFAQHMKYYSSFCSYVHILQLDDISLKAPADRNEHMAGFYSFWFSGTTFPFPFIEYLLARLQVSKEMDTTQKFCY